MRPIRLSRASGWYVLREAALLTGISKSAMFRAAIYGVLRLVKGPRTGRWFVRMAELRAAPILTIGAGAKRMGVCYQTVRRWAVGRNITTSVWRDGGARRISLQEIARVIRERRNR